MKQIILESKVKIDGIVERASNIFDYEFNGISSVSINIPDIPDNYQIGLIVGSSGSGKTKILKEIGEVNHFCWDREKAIISHFENYDDATEKLGASGLNSVPSWFKPYDVLSNGEKFRADLSMNMIDYAVIDEFTSVVNREVAISSSISIQKYIRNKGLKNVTFASCHYDIIDFLNPDWVYDTDTQKLTLGRLERQPNIELEIVACTTEAWGMFKKHHYLSEDIHKSATCYMAIYNNRPVAFIGLMHLTNRDVKSAWREHRVAVLPDFQGMGIGNLFSETVADMYKQVGKRYFSKTSNPRMGIHRNNSKKWRPTANNMKKRPSYFTKDGEVREQKGFGTRKEIQSIHANRICFSHEYVGL